MLSTLLKIGEWQSQCKGEWDRFLEKPKVKYETNKGDEITNYVLPIVFDLDEREVVIDSTNLREYDENLVESLKALKIQGGNNKAMYPTVPAGKLIQLYKTFFGKENKDASHGELREAFLKDCPQLLTDSLDWVLSQIFALKDSFLNQVSVINNKTNLPEVNIKAIENRFELNKNEVITLVYAVVKASGAGIEDPMPFAWIPDYLEFLKAKFFPASNDTKIDVRTPSVCYASGEISPDVKELELSDRYSLNKMFVTETRNYASCFAKDGFKINYQVSKSNQEKLDYASSFLLNEGGCKVKIANVDHVIIPQFLTRESVDWELALTGIKKKSDILFNLNELESFTKNIKDETDNIFWISFIAYESDGNFFKSTEIIKDISRFHFERVIEAFLYVEKEMRRSIFLDWNSVMMEYGKSSLFNLYTVYRLIPVRKDKEKKNRALDLFKSILENRRIEQRRLFDYFCELVLCHYYERYKSYTNIPVSSKDYFGKVIRDSVSRYFAFLQVLKKLNLIEMEETITHAHEDNESKYDHATREFFDKMKLNQDQKAMFYLGRMLSAVEYLQEGKNKTVIQKVNFNGMDRDAVERLRNGLMEKAKQYNSMERVTFINKKFGDLFDFNKWGINPMNSQEAVFFLLTGYSFGASKKEPGKKAEVEGPEN